MRGDLGTDGRGDGTYYTADPYAYGRVTLCTVYKLSSFQSIGLSLLFKAEPVRISILVFRCVLIRYRYTK